MMLDLESQPNHIHFDLPSGVFVHRWLCDSSRAIVILQHGFAEYAERYVWSHAKLIPVLNAQGFEVWAMDLWGHGRSPGNRGVVDVQKAVDDHIQIRHRAATLGLHVFLFGHSLGGLITAASAARDASPPNDGVVLSSPALPAAMIAPGERALGLLARSVVQIGTGLAGW
ncbi:uncharacterized protein FMAN_03652 [Fusarium mangiferae]|uniref:Serine aminopeptidase S33 domain-containing protein n=1 Tax=Fusarium mangiferae TaxID=192010 RepID=A0A1L7T7E4_FUSMA|nr:uncharacterized protein FMAN_03652 [Fusarium mangiferae]CVK94630.1 uncharacterized protein FMAN_03652 [Fusarium mangiferae]